MDTNDRMTHRLDATGTDATVGNPGDEVGEAVGGISGVLTGAALGSLGGPVGTIIGGIAGAVSGWWAGRAISDAASHVTDEDDAYYRTHYTSAHSGATGAGAHAAAAGSATGASSGMSGATRQYDDVRPAYQIGHLAGRNPEYSGRGFDEIEPDLQRGWTPEVSARHGEWNDVRGYARSAYDRSRMTGSTPVGAGASATGAAVTGAAHETGNAVERAWDATKAGAEHLADRAERAVDPNRGHGM